MESTFDRAAEPAGTQAVHAESPAYLDRPAAPAIVITDVHAKQGTTAA